MIDGMSHPLVILDTMMAELGKGSGEMRAGHRGLGRCSHGQVQQVQASVHHQDAPDEASPGRACI